MKKTFILFLSCWAIQLTICAQDQILQPTDAQGAVLSPSEASDLQHLQGLGYFTDHYLLPAFTLPETFADGTFDIAIPGWSCGTITYQAVDVAYQSEDNYQLYATILPNGQCSDLEGEMMLMANDNGTIGYLTVDSAIYEINQIGEAKLVLSRVDEYYFEGHQCGNYVPSEEPVEGKEPEDAKTEYRTPPYGHGNCKVRCLILYTSAAAEREGDNLFRKIDKAKSQTEQALRNSEVSQFQLSVEWLGPDSISFMETANIDDDIDNMTFDPEITSLRAEYLADIVIILTNGSYGNSNGLVSGIGPDSTTAFGLVNVDNATSGRYVFAHEFAHLFGGGHETDPRPGIPHGHEWRKHEWWGKKRRSILHTAPLRPKRVLHYSNPAVSAFGDRTGRSGTRDNAEVLRRGACAVATFLPEPEFIPFSSYIFGGLKECLCQTARFTVWTYGGDPGTVSTKWYTSTNGFDYAFAGDGEFLYYELPCPFPSNQLPTGSPNRVFIKAVSTSPDGQEFTDFHRLDFMALDEEECSFDTEHRTKNSGFGIQVSPNPISQQLLSIQWEDVVPCDNANIKVIDISGNLKIEEERSSLENARSLSVNISSLDNGIYFIY
ncbi:MAG: T9SS type A sorting domain-containing protein [Bacteroidota bacterium]